MLVTLRKEADVKQLELYTAQRLARHAAWDKEYLLTSPQAGPRLYWQPVRDNQATRRLRERHQAEREEWKVGSFCFDQVMQCVLLGAQLHGPPVKGTGKPTQQFQPHHPFGRPLCWKRCAGRSRLSERRYRAKRDWTALTRKTKATQKPVWRRTRMLRTSWPIQSTRSARKTEPQGIKKLLTEDPDKSTVRGLYWLGFVLSLWLV